jgi:hypothetical protein
MSLPGPIFLGQTAYAVYLRKHVEGFSQAQDDA